MKTGLTPIILNLIPTSPQELLEAKANFLEKISRKFPVDLGEQICWESNGIYGEILFVTLHNIFKTCREKHGLGEGGVFYDLGSGIGKAVVSAALLHSFDMCAGIELLPDLHNLAMSLKKKYEKNKSNITWLDQVTGNVNFFNDDIFQYDWTMATCFFANATCFDDEMITRISNYPVKAGTIGITTTKRLLKKSWRLLETSHKEMTWGKATVYIQKKI